MKKTIAAALCAVMLMGLTGCGGGGETQETETEIPRISPDSLISAETASTAAGATLKMSSDGIETDGNEMTVTYVADPIGSHDGVSVSIDQFSDTRSSSDIWQEYENERVLRTDAEMVSGIGADCYVAYPYIHIYDRGCHITISAGSGSDEGQKALLTNLGTTAAMALEAVIPEDAAESSNVIR